MKQMYIHGFGYCPVNNVTSGEATTTTGEIQWTQSVTFTRLSKKKVQNYPEKSNETQYSAHRRKYFLASYEKGDQLLQFSAPHNNLERKGN